MQCRRTLTFVGKCLAFLASWYMLASVAHAQRIIPPTPAPFGRPGVPLLDPQLSDQLRTFSEKINALRQAGQYREATSLAEEYVEFARVRAGRDHPAYAAALGLLALMYRLEARFKDAEPILKQALAINRAALGNLHRNVAIDLDSLAQVNLQQDRYAEAEQLSLQALDIIELTILATPLGPGPGAKLPWGPVHADLAAALNNLGFVRAAQGRYSDAEPTILRALEIAEAIGPGDAAVGRILSTLAGVDEGQGRLKEAESRYVRAISILEAAQGVLHPEVAIVTANLGGLYKSQGRLDEAEPLLKNALENSQTILGSNHPGLVPFLTQLADLYRRKGQCAEAEPLFILARSIGVKTIREVPVLFGTDRKRTKGEGSVAFSGERASDITFGLAIVTVPVRAGASAPDLLRPTSTHADISRPTIATRRLAMHCIQLMSDTALVNTAVRQISVSQRYPNQVLIFIHGYNLSFENSLKRAAQLAYDISFDGGTFLFSWPSREAWMDYLSDRETVDLAAEHFREFVKQIIVETKAAQVHFIAHSMGNMVLLRALERIDSGPKGLGGRLGEIISAAPDVDPDVFTTLVKPLRARGAGITLYASSGDWPLWLSGRMRDRPRAGYIKNAPLIIPGILDTIDITNAGESGWLNLFALNHDVYAANPLIVADMRKIIHTRQRPPDKRTREFEQVTASGGVYWRVHTPQRVQP